MAGETKIDFTNLPEFLRVLDNISKELPKEVQDRAATEVAKDWVSAARNKARGPYEQQAASSLNTGKESDGSNIRSNYIGFFGQEFGGHTRAETMMFPPHRGQRGYFLYPAARANAEHFQKVWEAAIDEATKGWK